MQRKTLVGTDNGIYELTGGERVQVDGHQVGALTRADSGWWAILDGQEVWQADSSGAWSHTVSAASLRANCLLQTGVGLFVGMSQAQMHVLEGNALETLQSFDEMPGRESWFTGCDTPEEYAQAARDTVAKGYTAMKFDPFAHEMQQYHTGYVSGTISAQGEDLGMARVAAVREAVGPQIEILIDAHGHYNVPTAIRIGNRLAEHKVTWYEEPVPPESYEALAQVRQNVSAPICVGERLFTRYDFVPVFENRLADYIMPDVVWTGGISELRKIANMAEAYYVPISPHNAMGSIQIIAGAHTMMGVPNFYRLEFSLAAMESYNAVLDRPLDIRDGVLHLSDKPGLGVDLDMDFLKSHPDPRWEG